MRGNHSTRRLCIVRKGHMGDVILTEPIARALRKQYDWISLSTEFEHVGHILDTYNEVISYTALDSYSESFDRVLTLIYEASPNLHYLDAYAKCAGIILEDRYPRLRLGNMRLIKTDYGLIAPETSYWIRNMRQWSKSKFKQLKNRLELELGIPMIELQESHNFFEMLSLVEHCSLFVGNDSGPAIIAQAYKRPSFVIFGATKPDRMLFHSQAFGIVFDVGCNGCKHFARNTDITCATPLCLNNLSVDYALNQIIQIYRNSYRERSHVRI